MVPRIFSIAAILAGTSLAWFVLGGTISSRSEASNGRLRDKVASVWGTPQTQLAPSAVSGSRQTNPEASDIQVGLRLQHRRKGLLWYSTYLADFQGDYDFRNTETESRQMQFWWTVPATGAVYDDLQVSWNGQVLSPLIFKDRAMVTANLESGQPGRLRIHYRTQGLDSWRYAFGPEIQQLPNFHLRVNTDFRAVDFEENTLAPTEKRESAQGWQLDWTYQNLFAGREIAVVMPARAQPGPLAAQISFFAPVSLLFFFFVMLMLTARRGVDLHPMNYFFMACSFFAFHLLMAYLVDHIDIYVSFGISATVSVFLLVSYLRIVVGTQFAIREAALAQLVYLVLFSFAFFFEGFTGLTVTIGAIVTLFITMQMTGAIRWEQKFASGPFKTNSPEVV